MRFLQLCLQILNLWPVVTSFSSCCAVPSTLNAAPSTSDTFPFTSDAAVVSTSDNFPSTSDASFPLIPSDG